eukprot:m.19151 g.19151  ORF g.19151 m.19151 type:complete len:293 (-) comp3407_c0_seq1:294-1172(-)
MERGVEHISDREDLTAAERKLSENVVSIVRRRSSSSLDPASSPTRKNNSDDLENDSTSLRNSHKFSSASNLLASPTDVSNIETTLECVARAIHVLVEEGHQAKSPLLFLHHFDERERPLTDASYPSGYFRAAPSEHVIIEFLQSIFLPSSLPAETAIVSLVYINRVVAYTGLALHATTWRRIVLGAIVLAAKVWDDLAVWNADFCQLFPCVALEDLNDLELTYLEMMAFNMNVEASLYTQCCFELHALAGLNSHLKSGSAEISQARCAHRHSTLRRALRPSVSVDALNEICT